MEDLVREGAADAGEGARVGQGPLQGVALAQERATEGVEGGLLDLDPSRVERRQTGLTPHQVKSGPALGTGLGHEQGAGREVEGRQAVLPGNRPRLSGPLEAAGDHQV